MSQNLIALFLATALGQFPGGGGSPYGPNAVMTAPNSTQAFGTGDPTNPYDFEPNWAHGYYQDIPAYHGHHLFRPYNYKHVMPQSQTAAAWGIPPQLPISHTNFNAVNGVPTTSFRPAPARTGVADLNSQFAKIDNETRNVVSRRQAASQVARRTTTQPRVLQTRFQKSGN